VHPFVKILHIDPDDIDNPLSGGGPVRTYEIYRRLADRHEITVLTPTFPGSTPEKIRDGIRYVRLGRRIGDHGSSHHITFFLSLPRAVRQFDFDLMVEDFMPPTSATLNPLFTRKPVIASVQWFFAQTLAQQYGIPFHWGERHGVRLYRHFVVLSDAMRGHIANLHSRANLRVIPNGVDESLFAVPIEPGDYILYIGRVDFGQKGVDLLLRAYARLEKADRLPMVVAGHGFDWDAVRDLCGELGVSGDVKMLGRVDAEERAKLLRGSRFVCVPSRTETFGMVIAEACAAGKPVVLFDRPPMNEVAAPDVCAAVTPFEDTAYADAMRGFVRMSDEELQARGARCREWAAQYRWDAIARHQERFYEEVVAVCQ